jgi:predicted homoserine dehydrogenase-like protein
LAKRDLVAGEVLDGLGGYMTYGEAENADIAAAENLLPIGVAEGCRVRSNITKGQAITYRDVEVPTGRLIDSLREEQARVFGLERHTAFA